MTEPTEHKAPQLGAPTDSNVGERALPRGDGGRDDMATSGGNLPEAEKTMDTPDELGGTGGEQAGGAG
jgi:hypothetical protein